MPNMDDIMKMAQGLQNDMAKAQASLDGIEVEGAAGWSRSAQRRRGVSSASTSTRRCSTPPTRTCSKT